MKSFFGQFAVIVATGESRDLEQMMGERGVAVDHSTIYRWVQKFVPEIESGCAGIGVVLNQRVGGSMKPM